MMIVSFFKRLKAVINIGLQEKDHCSIGDTDYSENKFKDPTESNVHRLQYYSENCERKRTKRCAN